MAEEKLGEKIRRARLARGLGVDELAKKAKINPASIYRIEKGERAPRASTIAKLFKTLAKIPKLPEL
jgi:transcriptional regulator with XRE-family HTH domain